LVLQFDKIKKDRKINKYLFEFIRLFFTNLILTI